MVEIVTDSKGRLLDEIGGDPITARAAHRALSARPFVLTYRHQQAADTLRRNLTRQAPEPAPLPDSIFVRWAAPSARIDTLRGRLEVGADSTSTLDLLKVDTNELERALNELPTVADGGGVRVFGGDGEFRRFRIVWNENGSRDPITRKLEAATFGTLSASSSETILIGGPNAREIVDVTAYPYPELIVGLSLTEFPDLTSVSSYVPFSGDGNQIDTVSFLAEAAGRASYRVGTDTPTRPLSIHSPAIKLLDALEAVSQGKISRVNIEEDGIEFVHATPGAQDPISIDDSQLEEFPLHEARISLASFILDLALTGSLEHSVSFEVFGLTDDEGTITTETLHKSQFSLDLTADQLSEIEGWIDGNPLLDSMSTRAEPRSYPWDTSGGAQTLTVDLDAISGIAFAGFDYVRSDLEQIPVGSKTIIGNISRDGTLLYPFYEGDITASKMWGLDGIKGGQLTVNFLAEDTLGDFVLNFHVTDSEESPITGTDLDGIITPFA